MNVESCSTLRRDAVIIRWGGRACAVVVKFECVDKFAVIQDDASPVPTHAAWVQGLAPLVVVPELAGKRESVQGSLRRELGSCNNVYPFGDVRFLGEMSAVAFTPAPAAGTASEPRSER